MDAVRALTLQSDVDLAMFCAYLAQQRVGHRVFEEQGQQVLEVGSQHDADRVREDYAAWRNGNLTLAWVAQPARPPRAWTAVLGRYPVVAALIALSVLCFPATLPLDHDSLGPVLPWLTIVWIHGDLHGSLHDTFASGQLWRLVTPIFLHFGIVHLAF